MADDWTVARALDALADCIGIPGRLSVTPFSNGNFVASGNDVVDVDSGGGTLSSAPLVWGGAAWERQRTPKVFKPVLNVAVVAGTPQVIWTPAAGKKFRLMGAMLSLSVAGFLSLDDDVTALDLVRFPAMPAAQGIGEKFGNGLLSAVANNTLRVDASASGNVNGMVWGTEE